MDLAVGERPIDQSEARTNLVFFWLKTQLILTTNRLVGTIPNTVLLAFPVGRKEITQPLNRISNVSLDSRFHVIRLILGLVALLAGVSLLSNGGNPTVLFVIGAIAMAYSYTATVSITDNSGRSQNIPVSVLDKAEIERFIDVVNKSLSESNASERANPGPSHPTDRMAQLARLGDLKLNGVLTDAEFQAEKRKLLAT